MDAARARRLLIQQGETARFFGVDFVPVRVDLSPACDHHDAHEIEPPPDAPVAPGPQPGPQPGPGAGDPVTAPAPTRAHAFYTPIEIPEGDLPRERAQELLDEVRARYERDAPHQHFNTSFTNIVFGEGDPRARLMFVGEAPGETEDKTGRPFVGKAGQLLDKMIVAMGLSRESVYICNVLKTRPPGNATPTRDEASACAPYLLDQIRVVRPEVIVTLGLPATHLLLDRTESMRSLRGAFHAFPPEQGEGAPTGLFGPVAGVPPIPVMPTYHPAYLLRSYTEENRRKVWSDLRLVIERLGLDQVKESGEDAGKQGAQKA